MAATDARPIPRKNTLTRLYFDFRDSVTGGMISTPAGVAVAVSKDGGTFTTCTNTFVEIGTSGAGYLELTATETNCDAYIVRATSTSADAVPVTLYVYPEEGGDIRVNVNYWNGTAVDTPATAGVPNVNLINWRGTQPLILNPANLVQVVVEAASAGSITATSIATGAIDQDALAATALTVISDAVADHRVEIQGTISLQQAVSVILAAVAGRTTGGGANFLSPNGVATRIVATTNASNERTAITLTPST